MSLMNPDAHRCHMALKTSWTRWSQQSTTSKKNKYAVGFFLLTLFCLLVVVVQPPSTTVYTKCIDDILTDSGSVKQRTADLGSQFRIAFADEVTTFKWERLPRSDVCAAEMRSSVQIFAVVVSRADSFAFRMAIRETWMNARYSHSVRNGRIRFVFLVGQDRNEKVMHVVHKETEEFDDIVIVDVEDRYENLLYKSIAALLYAKKRCNQSALIMKIDEDVILLPDMLSQLVDDDVISVLPNSTKIYGYIFDTGVPPIRDPSDKWFTSIDAFSCSAFPEYVSGPMYLLSQDAARAIAFSSARRNFITLEDVMITGLLARDLRLSRVHLPHIFYTKALTSEGDVSPLLAWHGIKDTNEFRTFFLKFLDTRCPPCTRLNDESLG